MLKSRKAGMIRRRAKGKLKIAAAFILAVIMTLTAVPSVFSSDEYPVREGDYPDAGSGNVLMGIEGEFVAVDETAKGSLLAEVNRIRREACEEGVADPNNPSKKLTLNDYVPLKWSQLLEKATAMRAVESSVFIGHGRLSSDSSVFINNYNVQINAENLAWNWEAATVDAIFRGISQWYEEKDDWISVTDDDTTNNSQGQTGHYENLINPKLKYIGLAGFYNASSSYAMTVANQLSSTSDVLDESVAGIGGKVTQKTRVAVTRLSGFSISGPSMLSPGDTASLLNRATVTISGSSGHGPLFSGIKWESSDPSVVTVDSAGNVAAVKEGAAVITAKIEGTALSATLDINVSETVDPELRFASIYLSLSDSLTVNFKIPKAPFTGTSAIASDPFVQFSFNGEEYVVKKYRTEEDCYVFRFEDIAPDMMSDSIKAMLFVTVKDNAEPKLVASITYSIADYCRKLLEIYGDDADNNMPLLKLVVDTLNYGAAAQQYTGHNTSNLANAALTADQKAWGTSVNYMSYGYNRSDYKTVPSPEVEWEESGLTLNSGITVRLKIAADDISGLVLKITDNGSLNWSIPSSKFVKIDGTGEYYVYFSGLNPAQFDTAIYAHFERNDKTVSNTLYFKINNYIGELLNNKDSATLHTLLWKLYSYGLSAKEYVKSLG
ncbi:MAG: Ig-like domain-containing protein [Clostridia bacterium]|nr:Ig-like domain-containing protein [Clostridia bacterium]